MDIIESPSLLAEFGSLKSDKERWEWIITHKDIVTVMLDNDDTFIVVEGQEGFGQIDDFVGNSAGLDYLFAAVGIKVDGV